MERVLEDGIVKLMFFTSKIQDFGPGTAFTITINPAVVIFGFENIEATRAAVEATVLAS